MKRTPCLVTNDDGIDSDGLRQLAGAAVRADFDVVVAAPDQEASGSSAAMPPIAADGKIMISRRELAGLPAIPAYAVHAAPAFIAFTAVRGAFGQSPGVLVSGINQGPNTGRAVLHSGTVGAAMTAALHGVRAAAFSLDWRGDGEQHWDTAVAVVERLLPGLGNQQPGAVLNVNVPNVPPAELRGIRPGPLAAAGAVQLRVVASTRDYLHVTMHEPADWPPDGSDAALLAAGFATVTSVLPLCEVPLADSALPGPD
jgi:5'-nucleotidase